ncbi:MAG: hypothetical protein IJV14_03070 [Lachnospiraceae bacterium]|nr:hypothetical protein [Lachnospiraceae bacterium]
MGNDRMLELLEIYTEMTEKQGDLIYQLGQIVKKQAIELAHLRNMLNVEITEAQREDIKTTSKVLKQIEDDAHMEP